tara:strand:+ start:474 stop:1091 length:618 start_codon:yes stop_codon:yes gene_type:complete
MERKFDFNGFFVHPMSRKDAIINYFPSFVTTYNELTVGPDSDITHSCEETNTGPYLSYDSIYWNDYCVLDIKAGSFISGMAQKVITRILNNDQQKLKITLYVNDLANHLSNDLNNYMINNPQKMLDKILDYFNQVKDISKMICLEYKVKCGNDQDVYVEGIRDLKTDIFSDIEIWRCINPNYDSFTHKANTICDEHPWKVCKWEE